MMPNNLDFTLEKSDLEHIFSKLSDTELNKFSNSSILVTGASGFFGRNIMEFLIYLKTNKNINLRIAALTRNIENFKSKFPLLNQVDFVHLIESNISEVAQKTDTKFDFIIHAACDTNPDSLKNHPLQYLKENYSGIENILEIAKRSANCNMLYLSSGAVYGAQDITIANMEEKSISSPNINDANSVYGESKRFSEMLCTLYAKKYDLNVNIARCYSFLGPYMEFDGHFAIGNFIKNVADNEDIILKSRSQVFRSYLYSADLVIWLMKILLSEKKSEVYNVGSNRAISIEDLANLVKVTLNSKSNVVFKEKEIFNTTSSSRYVPSVSKIKNDLQVEEWISLEEAIKKTYQWYLKNNQS